MSFLRRSTNQTDQAGGATGKTTDDSEEAPSTGGIAMQQTITPRDLGQAS